MKSSPLERPKNRYRSFSFWNLSFNDGSRLWRQAPSVTEGQKGANKFSKVCIVPYIYIYLDCFKLCNRKNISKSSWCVLFRLFAARVSRVSEIYTQPKPPFSFYNCPSIERKNRQNWWKFCSKRFLIVISSNFLRVQGSRKFVFSVKNKVE